MELVKLLMVICSTQRGRIYHGVEEEDTEVTEGRRKRRRVVFSKLSQ